MGGGAELQSEYKSVIYKHQDMPAWYETFKIAVPIEEFYNCHLKFTFKHISGNEGMCIYFMLGISGSKVLLIRSQGARTRTINHTVLWTHAFRIGVHTCRLW